MIQVPPHPSICPVLGRARGRDWYAGFANYPGDHGGEPGHDHRWTLLVKLDPAFRPIGSWRFPDDVLARFAPTSNSGGSWGSDGLLYVTGHDRSEMYALRLPEAGTMLEHVRTIAIATNGQAFVWDRSAPGTFWSIERGSRIVVVSRLGESPPDR